MEIKRGMKFVHKHWLEDDYKTPATFEVTRVANGFVYYKHPDSSKATMKFALEKAENSVLRWLE